MRGYPFCRYFDDLSLKNMIKKIDARKLMKNMRSKLDESFIKSASLTISKIAYGYAMSNSFKKAAIYMSIKNEARIEYLIDLNTRKDLEIFLPSCKKENCMNFYKFEDLCSMRRDSFGILCPENGYKIDEKEIDVFFVPGLAFDASGNRVGYGRGCYDKILMNADKSYFVGICYDFQLIKNNVLESHAGDVAMDFIITECEIFKVVSSL